MAHAMENEEGEAGIWLSTAEIWAVAHAAKLLFKLGDSKGADHLITQLAVSGMQLTRIEILLLGVIRATQQAVDEGKLHKKELQS